MSKQRKGKPPPKLSDQLRSAIAESGLSHYRIALETGVSQPIITRFANATRSISLDTADKLAAYLGMTLTPPNLRRVD